MALAIFVAGPFRGWPVDRLQSAVLMGLPPLGQAYISPFEKFLYGAGERPRRQSAPRTSFYHHFHIIGDFHIILSRFSVSLPQIRRAMEALR